MYFAKLTMTGQITIAKSVGDADGLIAGHALHFTLMENGTLIVRVKNRGSRNLALTACKRRHVRVEQTNR